MIDPEKVEIKLNQKLIFLDIDGTLTAPGKNEPPESALTVIAQAQANGHKVFLCTGRNYNMLSPLLKYNFDGVIASSGGYVEVEGELIYDRPFTEAQKAQAMDILAKHKIFRTVECVDGSFTDDGLKDFLRDHSTEGENSELLRWREQLEASLGIRPMDEYEGQPIYKIVMMATSEADLMGAQAEFTPDFACCIQESSGGAIFNGELISSEYDKGQAVMRVCRYLNIPVEDTIGFGDSMNDLEMMETVGTGICMANGSEQLKAMADDICPAYDRDGIKTAFIKYDLI